MESKKRLEELLIQLYGSQVASVVLEKLAAIIEAHRPNIKPKSIGLSQRDSFLITYPDQVQEENIPPLRSLADFCSRHLAGLINNIHILPFYPWTSDDGFAIADYRSIALGYGDWEDLRSLQSDFRLMFDAVINHSSVAHAWFQGMLAGDARYQDYYISPDGNADLSQVVRPRALPLLTEFETVSGKRKIWTTFGPDQVDLNYKNPEVLLEIIDTILFYVEQGADTLRMDAIAYLWKEPGTSCIHLPEVHVIIKLFRVVLDEVAAHVSIITETNVPHLENISYFGNGKDEAQLVYNFPLPPLILNAFQNESATSLAQWAAELSLPSDKATFFNFLASHDGIGLNPLRGILAEEEIERVVERAMIHGALVSYKEARQGEKKPYELNINYFDALNLPDGSDPTKLQVDRFIAAHAILLCMPGVPAIYFHSLLGMRGWPEGVFQTGRNRTINRQKFTKNEIEDHLLEDDSRQIQVFQRLAQLLNLRSGSEAFHPHGSWKILKSDPAVFGILRKSPGENRSLLCLQNVSGKARLLDSEILKELGGAGNAARDIISNRYVSENEPIQLQAYEGLWLESR